MDFCLKFFKHFFNVSRLVTKVLILKNLYGFKLLFYIICFYDIKDFLLHFNLICSISIFDDSLHCLTTRKSKINNGIS